MKPYLITAASRTEGFERFRKSLDNIKVDWLSIEFLPYMYAGNVRFNHRIPYVGNIKRFAYIPKLHFDDKYIIFSDTDDVIFQKDLPDFSKMDYDVFIGNERILHKDTIWKDVIEPRPVFHILLEKTVCNAGLFCMKVSLFNEYVSFIKGYIDRHENVTGWGDQLLLNYFLLQKKYKIYDDISLFCPLYANLDQGLVEKKDEKWIVKKTGELIVAVHSNGIKNRI